MRKFFFRLVAVLLIVGICLSGWLWYRQYRSYQSPIHRQANLMIKVNADAIVRTLAADFLTRPGDYLSTDVTDSLPDSAEVNSGLRIPANVFIYNLTEGPRNSFFSSLPVADSAEFKQFARKKLKVTEFTEAGDGLLSASGEKGRVRIMLSAGRMAISWSPRGEDTREVLKDILLGRNLMEPSAEVMRRLKKGKGHLVWLWEEQEGALRFRDGKIMLLANLQFNCLKVPESIKLPVQNNSACAHLWLEADLSACLQGKSWELPGGYRLQGDSLNHYLKGGLGLTWTAGTVQQQDSVIRYTYNDDFEKVAKVEIVEKQVPRLNLALRSDAAGLLHYLQWEGLFPDQWRSIAGQPEPASGKQALKGEIFPLYTLQASTRDDYFHLGTGEPVTTTFLETPTANFLNVRMNAVPVSELGLFPKLTPSLMKLDVFWLKAQQNAPGSFRLSGALEFRDKELNSFIQLIR